MDHEPGAVRYVGLLMPTDWRDPQCLAGFRPFWRICGYRYLRRPEIEASGLGDATRPRCMPGPISLRLPDEVL